MIHRYISAKLGICMGSRIEMEGTDVSRLHDEMGNVAMSLVCPKRVLQCDGRQKESL